VVEENQIGFDRGGHGGNFFDFSRADKRCRIEARAALHELGRDDCAGAGNKLAELGKRLFGVEGCERGARS
jgi:hypothetical protein